MAGKTFRMPAPVKLTIKPPTVDFTSGGDAAGVMVQCTGLQSLEDNLLSLGPVFVDAAGYEMSEIAGDIIEDARDNYVPVLSGALKDSAGWDEYRPNRGMGVTDIGMWFGAPTTVTHSNIAKRAAAAAIGEGLHIAKDPHDYALDQHENLSYRHDTINGAGPLVGPKYLERPFIKAEPTIVPRIAGAINRAVGGGFLDTAATLYGEGEVVRTIPSSGNDNSLDAIAERLDQRNPYPGYGSNYGK